MRHMLILSIVSFLLTLSTDINAHEGHDHGGTNKNIELKPSLNINQLNSTNTAKGLQGVVIADPNYSAILQSPYDGQITFKNLYLGQMVKKGSPIAELNVIAPVSDTVQINSSLADINAKIRDTQANLIRQKALQGFVSPRQIESLEIQLSGLREQKQKLSQLHQKRIILRSPIDGVINKINMIQGQIVSPKEILIEIIQPNKLLIEANYYQDSVEHLRHIKQAKSLNNVVVNIKNPRFLPSLRNQSRVVQFQIEAKSSPLLIGQPMMLLLN